MPKGQWLKDTLVIRWLSIGLLSKEAFTSKKLTQSDFLLDLFYQYLKLTPLSKVSFVKCLLDNRLLGLMAFLLKIHI